MREGVAVNGDRVREALEGLPVEQVTIEDVLTSFEGNLWMLSPAAFLHYLPVLMDLALTRYNTISVFASELVGALTEPSRDDVLKALDRFEQDADPGLMPSKLSARLRQQQLEWFDSGTATAVFRDRFGGLSPAEGAAVLEFLEAFKEQFADYFPFGELDVAIGRYWAAFRNDGAR